ncbi:hypothetical protein H4R34_003951 [Dimargaris verticillata]|uniref:Uncharacterized protein n=1 Tax=Dimargaris verticillata TaxID=2761393 RepID=A0A9W8B554_9FUNG|nr:hypothetical protein H4R34_003951 [Dimargaris verticillata]
MARITLWFLATMAAVGLARAATLPEKDVDTTNANPQLHSADTKEQDRPPLLKLPSELFHNVVIELPIEAANSLELASELSLMSVKDQLDLYGGKVFYDLRRKLDLPDVMGLSAEVGLRTLLDGAQLEYRGLTGKFLEYIYFVVSNENSKQEYFVDHFPGLFQNDLFWELDLPPFVASWISIQLQEHDIPPNNVQHSLANLGLTSGPKYIVGVIKALFAMLKNKDDLLKEFEAMVQQVPEEPQGDQDVASTDQASAAIVGSEPDEAQVDQVVVLTDQKQKERAQALSREFRAFIDRFWLEVIGGGKKEQLCYFLSNMLAFDVIPRILGQVLESGNYDKALELARQVSQLPDFTEFVKECQANAPNYFEFIMMYATMQKLDGFEALLPDAQRDGNVDVSFLYNCFEGFEEDFSLDVWKDIFGLELPLNFSEWQVCQD